MSTIQSIIDRAASDPDFLKRLAQDPAGTVQTEGLQVSTSELKSLLDMPEATDQEVAEALHAHLSHSGTFSLTQVTP